MIAIPSTVRVFLGTVAIGLQEANILGEKLQPVRAELLERLAGL